SSGVCQGMAPVSERGNGPQAGRWLAWGQRWPFGAPSAGLSLGGLLASRAHLRFTRRGACTATTIGEQGQAVQHARLRMCYGYDGRTGQSEGSHGFGLDNGVHLSFLFHRTCRPLAPFGLVGVFHGPWLVVALDGTVVEAPDTPANRRVLGAAS